MDTINITDDFSAFCRNLEISSDTQETVKSRLKSIVKRINLDFWDSDSDTTHFLVVGSYGRGTAIATSDIDVVVELPWGEFSRFDNYSGNGQSALLQSVRETLLKTYSTSKISGDGQVVDIDFSDGIKFEIVPAFKHSDGSYTYADTNNGGSWKTMDPSFEMYLFSAADSKYNGNLVRLCRMSRAWKEKMTVLMPGILIDSIAYYFLQNYKYAGNSFIYYDWISRDFFKYILDRLEKEPSANKWDRIMPSEKITMKHPGSVKTDSKKAYDLSCQAISACEEKWYYTWHEKWRSIYGTKFPDA